jgi:hypothetical protein
LVIGYWLLVDWLLVDWLLVTGYWWIGELVTRNQ